MWTVVSDSDYDHEREALLWLRENLPKRRIYHGWVNFEFTTRNGQLYEVDALAITDNGVHLIEVKSHRGEIVGDSGTWQNNAPNGRFSQFDNPRILANRKAKALKSVLEATGAFRKERSSIPYIQECIFLSDPNLKVGLNSQGRHNVFGRDAPRGTEVPPQRANLGGVVDHLTSLSPEPNGRPRRRLDRRLAERLEKAINQAGIRERSSRRLVGDYRMGRLLEDVVADTTSGVIHSIIQRRKAFGFPWLDAMISRPPTPPSRPSPRL